jgi:excinuclease UvrABC ATPase subunit
VAVTGVSGSGKSTLLFDIVAPALAAAPSVAGRDAVVTAVEPFARLVAAVPSRRRCARRPGAGFR